MSVNIVSGKWFKSGKILFLLLFFAFQNQLINAQRSYSICDKAGLIVQTSRIFHYEPRPVDDEFSELVYKNFLNMLDPEGLFLASEDVELLSTYKNNLDDEILNNRCGFLTMTEKIYTNSVIFVDSVINSFLIKEFNYSLKDTLFVTEEVVYAKRLDLSKKWEKYIKLDILYSYLSQADSTLQSVKPNDDSLAKFQPDVIQRELCYIKSRTNFTDGISQYIGSLFLESVSMAFDPHTNYFSAPEKDEFMGSLSKENESFGFDFDINQRGEVVIYNVAIGGPAWKSNEIEEGDVVLGLKTNSEEMTNFSCLAVEDIYRIIYSEKLNKATFRIRKKSGKEIYIQLNKETVSVETNEVVSLILKDSLDNKTGYIYLPSFYTGTDYQTGEEKGCANDVAKEIIRLKNEQISGLIIDLRNNGGGAMEEAIKLAGMFIDFGAVGIIHVRNLEPEVLKDKARGTIYDGPLAILVNGTSASASEFFASAMQDYNRAIIAGTKTFGKFTAQNILPVDACNYSMEELVRLYNAPNGYLKITNGKFFNVTGKSYQNSGITPDIEFPSIYEGVNYRESSYESSLKSTVIEKKVQIKKFPELPIESLNLKSVERLKADSVYFKVSKIGKLIIERQKCLPISVEYHAFVKYFNDNEIAREMEKLAVDSVSALSVTNPGYIAGVSSTDSLSEYNEYSISRVKRDFFIREVYNIINDLINENKNK